MTPDPRRRRQRRRSRGHPAPPRRRLRDRRGGDRRGGARGPAPAPRSTASSSTTGCPTPTGSSCSTGCPRDRPPVVVLTGQGDERVAVDAMKRGADDYLVKATLDAAGLRRAIDHAIDTAQLRARVARRDAQLRIILEQLPATVWTTDRDLRIRRCTAPGSAPTSAPEAVGRRIDELPHGDDPDDPGGVRRPRSPVTRPASSSSSTTGSASAGSSRCTGPTARSTGTIGVAADVTETRRARRAAPPLAEVRGAGPARRRRRPRLQQHPDRDPELRRGPGVRARPRQPAVPRRRRHPRGVVAGDRAGPPAARVLAAAAGRAARGRRRQGGPGAGPDAGPAARRGRRARPRDRRHLGRPGSTPPGSSSSWSTWSSTRATRCRGAAASRIAVEDRRVDVAIPLGTRGVVAPGDYVSLVGRGRGHRHRARGASIGSSSRSSRPRTSARAPGSGLSTVYGIARQAGGEVLLSSEPGAGARFEVLLPRSTAPRLVRRARPTPSAPPPIAGRVLVVEDDRQVRALVERALRSAGMEVAAAASPGEALAWCRSAKGPLALILADLVLPEMNGHELASEVRRIYPDAQVLYMSGHVSESIGERIGIEGLTRDPREAVHQGGAAGPGRRRARRGVGGAAGVGVGDPRAAGVTAAGTRPRTTGRSAARGCTTGGCSRRCRSRPRGWPGC